jgi:hypothetical protein
MSSQRSSSQQVVTDASALAQPQLSQRDFASQSLQLSSSFPPSAQLQSADAAPPLFPRSDAGSVAASNDDADSSMSPRPTRLQTHSSWERNQIQTYAQMSQTLQQQQRAEAHDVVAFMSAHSDTIRASGEQSELEQSSSPARELKRAVSFGTIVYHPEIDAARETDQQQRQQLPQQPVVSLPASLPSASDRAGNARHHDSASSTDAALVSSPVTAHQRHGGQPDPTALSRAQSLARLASPSPRPPPSSSSTSRTATAALATNRLGTAPVVVVAMAAPTTLPVSPRFVHGPSAATLSSQARIAPTAADASAYSKAAAAGASTMAPASARGGGGGVMRARVGAGAGLRYPLKSAAARQHGTASTSKLTNTQAANRRPVSAARAPAPFFTPQKQVQPPSQKQEQQPSQPQSSSLSATEANAPATSEAGVATANANANAERSMRRSELDERATSRGKTSPAAATVASAPISAHFSTLLSAPTSAILSPPSKSKNSPCSIDAAAATAAASRCPRVACQWRTAALSADIAALTERAANAERRAAVRECMVTRRETIEMCT